MGSRLPKTSIITIRFKAASLIRVRNTPIVRLRTFFLKNAGGPDTFYSG